MLSSTSKAPVPSSRLPSPIPTSPNRLVRSRLQLLPMPSSSAARPSTSGAADKPGSELDPSRRGRGRGRGRGGRGASGASGASGAGQPYSRSAVRESSLAGSNDDDGSEGDGETEGEPKRKRSKVGRACLQCRRKKAKCDSDGRAPCQRCLQSAAATSGGSDPAVAHARALAVCHYVEMEDKAAYSRRYVETLEARLGRMEEFVRILAPTLNATALSKANELGLLQRSTCSPTAPPAIPAIFTDPPPSSTPVSPSDDPPYPSGQASGSATPVPPVSTERASWNASTAGRIEFAPGHSQMRYLGPSSSITLVMDAASALTGAGAFGSTAVDAPHSDPHANGQDDHPNQRISPSTLHTSMEDPDAHVNAIDSYLLYALSPLHVQPPKHPPHLQPAGPNEVSPVAQATTHFNSAAEAFAHAAAARGTPAADLKGLPKPLADRLWDTYIIFVHPLFPILDPHDLRRRAEAIFFVDDPGQDNQSSTGTGTDDILTKDPMLVANVLAVFACASRVLGAHESRVCPPVSSSRVYSDSSQQRPDGQPTGFSEPPRPPSAGHTLPHRPNEPSAVSEPVDEDQGGKVDGTLAGLHFFVQSELLSLHALTADRPSLAMVHCIGLRAYYLASSNCAARAWIIMGRAMRMAQDLGLHRDLDLDFPPLPSTQKAGSATGWHVHEPELRRRTWWCVYLMDRLLSVSLGRPFGVADDSVDQQLPREPLIPPNGSQTTSSDGQGKSHSLGSVEGFNEMVKISRLMGQVARNAFVRQRRDRRQGKNRLPKPRDGSSRRSLDGAEQLAEGVERPHDDASLDEDEEPRSNPESDMDWEKEDGLEALPPWHDVCALHRWFAAVPDQFKHAQAQVRVQETSNNPGSQMMNTAASTGNIGDLTQHYLALQSCAASVMYRQTTLLSQRSLIQSILSGSLDHRHNDQNHLTDSNATTLEEEEVVLTECRKTSMTLIRSATTIASTLAASPYLLEYGQQLLVAGGYLALTAWRRHLSLEKGSDESTNSKTTDTPSIPGNETPAALLGEAAQACEALRRLELALPAASVLGWVLHSLVDKLRRKLGAARPREDQFASHDLQPTRTDSRQDLPSHTSKSDALSVPIEKSPMDAHVQPTHTHHRGPVNSDMPGSVPFPSHVDDDHNSLGIHYTPLDMRPLHTLTQDVATFGSSSGGGSSSSSNTHIPPAASHLRALAGDAGVGLQLAPMGLQTWNEMVQDSLGSINLFPATTEGEQTPLGLSTLSGENTDLLPRSSNPSYNWDFHDPGPATSSLPHPPRAPQHPQGRSSRSHGNNQTHQGRATGPNDRSPRYRFV